MTPTPPDWSKAPAWANYHAWDQWGTAWWYESRPELLTFDAVDWLTGMASIWQCWRPVDARRMYPAAVLPLVDGQPVEVDGWQDTLEARPGTEPPPEPPPVPVTRYALLPDISQHQGEIDWPKLAAQLRANGATDLRVYMRGAIGKSGSDMRLAEYHREAGLNGFKRGMYGLWKPDWLPGEQAQHFADVYNRYAWELAPAGDFEIAPANGRNVGNEIFAYLSEIANRLHVIPMVYTGKQWWQRWVGSVAWAATFPLWLAVHYNPPATIHPPERFWPGDLPAGWDSWDMWQFSSTMPGAAWGVQSAGLDMNWLRS